MKIVSFDMVKDILACGSSSFFIELASGFVIFIFNLQLLKYLGDNAIVVYGIISNCMLVATSLFNGVGQATQPIISTNHGANETQRVKNIVKYALYTTIAIGLVLFLGVFIFTKEIIQDKYIQGDSKNWANWMSELSYRTCKLCEEKHGTIVC